MTDAKLWYGFLGTPYEGSEPAFYEPKDFPWAQYMEQHWTTIREELNVLIEDENDEILKPYFEDKIQYPPKNWKTESFAYWSKKNHRMCNRFPQTYKILQGVPGLVSASVNLLEAGGNILPHFGDTNAILRCHMGVRIPTGLPDCGFRVLDETLAWEEGKLLIFLDAYRHEGFNLSKGKRYILLFDVIRPEFADKKNEVCVNVLSMLTLYWIMNRFTFLIKLTEKWPDWLKGSFLIPLRIIWYIYLPVQRRFDFNQR